MPLLSEVDYLDVSYIQKTKVKSEVDACIKDGFTKSCIQLLYYLH